MLTVSSPTNEDYVYDADVQIEWLLNGNSGGKSSGSQNCSLVNLNLYQERNHTMFKAQLNYLEPEADFITWRPSDTKNPDTGYPYDDDIVGTEYSISVECSDNTAVAGWSEYFSLVTAPTHTPTPHPSTYIPTAPTDQPSNSPTPLPSAQPIPMPSIIPSKRRPRRVRHSGRRRFQAYYQFVHHQHYRRRYPCRIQLSNQCLFQA